ncbi:MAG: hypothetical protein HC927_00895 [Deltaproteobacteria bacterium]|nr:hypothetical protein [Deltaproteobacteria bacterium]
MLDEAIRTALDQDLPADRFGPSLAKLYAQRRVALQSAGTGSIAVECQVPCRVFINEHAVETQTDGLVLGEYRVWIEATEQEYRHYSTSVALVEPGQTATLEYDKPPEPPKSPELPPQQPQHKRLLPLGAEAAMLVVGSGVAVLGTVLATTNLDSRPMLIGGATAAALGGVALIAGAVTLGIDEVRDGKDRARRLSLVWTIKF